MIGRTPTLCLSAFCILQVFESDSAQQSSELLQDICLGVAASPQQARCQ